MAQTVGGRYGLPHGAMNALCLPPVLRFNGPVAGDAIARFAAATGASDAAERAEELARLAGFGRCGTSASPTQICRRSARRRRSGRARSRTRGRRRRTR